MHVNGGGGLDRGGHPFGIWGVIGELPHNSALLGLIWQASKTLSLNAGVRHGISHAAPDWQFTLGLTFGFSLRAFSRQ